MGVLKQKGTLISSGNVRVFFSPNWYTKPAYTLETTTIEYSAVRRIVNTSIMYRSGLGVKINTRK